MREGMGLYRGKRLDNGKWVEGYYVGPCKGLEAYEICDISDILGSRVEIDPTTCGQYTGLTDKNGKQIWEGDICRVCRGVDIETGPIYYDERIAAYGVRYGQEECNLLFDIILAKDPNVWIEVIGNIHDTPELLERGRE